MLSIPVVDPGVGAFLALDVASFLLAGTVAAFFWRTHRLIPGSGYAVQALAFAVLAVSYLSVASSEFRVLRGSDPVDAVRAGGQFLGVLLVFLGYAWRRRGGRPETLHVAAAAASTVAVAYFVLYFVVPPRGLPEPLAYLPWLRFTEFGLLAAAAYFVASDVRGRTLRDFQVPLAFLLLALGKYSWGLLAHYRVQDAAAIPYVWRLAGLLILLHVVWPRKGWARAPA